MVRLLIEWDANLLIRNRKGNTACSLAEGRVQPETLELLRQREKEQLQEGGMWLDYSTKETENGNQFEGINCLKEQSEKTDNAIPVPDDKAKLKRLSKKLRDSAGKRGRFDVVRSIIDEVGDDFPEVSVSEIKYMIVLV